MYFPVSGAEANPLVLLLVAFLISFATAPAGISGAFLLLPFQVSILGFTEPAVSATNLVYNVVATLGGIYSYIREGRMMWPLVWTVSVGTIPGIFVGAILRVRYFSDPAIFKALVGTVLLYLGLRMLHGAIFLPLRRWIQTRVIGGSSRRQPASSTPDPIRARKSKRAAARSFEMKPVFLLSLAVGVVGGIYGVGGAAIIAPFLVAILGLSAIEIAGAVLMSTFVTSIAGIAAFEMLAAAGVGGDMEVSPDWLLGAVLGAGGLAGTYAGARVQKHLPETLIKTLLATLVLILGLTYLLQLLLGIWRSG